MLFRSSTTEAEAAAAARVVAKKKAPKGAVSATASASIESTAEAEATAAVRVVARSALSAQPHLVTHLEGRIHPPRVQRRLALLLRRVDQRPHLLRERLHPVGVGPRGLEALPRVGQCERMVRVTAAVDEERVSSPPSIDAELLMA